MSSPHEPIICPNCSQPAEKNYCAQCGQETHLHDDTFGALLMHFIGHYFHYDSKFWQTMKALLFSPGKLTMAYWNKQRMRYIPPISLYIFISAVFFLINSFVGMSELQQGNTAAGQNIEVAKHERAADSTIAALQGPRKDNLKTTLGERLINKGDKIKHLRSDEEQMKEFTNHFFHLLPRVFFFMIPFMALMLQLLFLRRKDMSFVKHVIFSLHFQSAWFTLMAIIVFYPFDIFNNIIAVAVLSWIGLYFLISLKRVYGTTWLRSVLYTLVLGVAFGIVLIAGMAAVMMLAV